MPADNTITATPEPDLAERSDQIDTEPHLDRPVVISRAGFPWMLFVGATTGALAIALLVSWWFLRTAADDTTVTPTELVSGHSNTDATVSGDFVRGKPAPAASFTYFDGSQGTLQAFTGTTVVLNFWSSTCAPCVKEMPALERLHQTLGDKVAFLGIDVGELPTAGAKRVKETGVTYPQVQDPSSTMLTAFGATALPHTVVIGPDGVVVGVHQGKLETGDLESLLGTG